MYEKKAIFKCYEKREVKQRRFFVELLLLVFSVCYMFRIYSSSSRTVSAHRASSTYKMLFRLHLFACILVLRRWGSLGAIRVMTNVNLTCKYHDGAIKFLQIWNSGRGKVTLLIRCMGERTYGRSSARDFDSSDRAMMWRDFTLFFTFFYIFLWALFVNYTQSSRTDRSVSSWLRLDWSRRVVSLSRSLSTSDLCTRFSLRQRVKVGMLKLNIYQTRSSSLSCLLIYWLTMLDFMFLWGSSSSCALNLLWDVFFSPLLF